MSIRVPALLSGGLITNYHCTSSCRHCLYRSSPNRGKGYVEPDAARKLLRTARRLGCDALHIGGGEPFLNRQGLREVLLAARGEGVSIEYVETNSSWFTDMDRAVALLRELGGLGLSQLLVSISPFHNEYIPLRKVRGVMEASARAGIAVFPWVRSLLPDLERFDAATPHSMDEYEAVFGPGYLATLPDRYWVNWGGRALDTYRPLSRLVPLAEVLAGADPCRSLLDTTHFHMDLYGNYIPGMCAGLAIGCDDLPGPLDAAAYPLLNTLVDTGVAGLVELAETHGVTPSRPEYMNKCDLCDDMRAGLVRAGWNESEELAPAGFYRS